MSPPCVLQLASLRNEEVILDQIAFSNKYVVVMETCNRHRITYQVSLESLRSEEEKCLRLFVCNVVILMWVIECVMSRKFGSHSSYQL